MGVNLVVKLESMMADLLVVSKVLNSVEKLVDGLVALMVELLDGKLVVLKVGSKVDLKVVMKDCNLDGEMVGWLDDY